MKKGSKASTPKGSKAGTPKGSKSNTPLPTESAISASNGLGDLDDTLGGACKYTGII
jgi:hypothetical protein